MFFAVLLVGTAGAAAALKFRGSFSARDAARIGMPTAMAVAGFMHWLVLTPFVQHLPPWVPAREELVFLTGALEVALGVALVGPRSWRRLTGRALAGYFLAVFPANIYVAVSSVQVGGQPGGIYPWIRLPFQLLFIAWALWSTAPALLRLAPDLVRGERQDGPGAAGARLGGRDARHLQPSLAGLRRPHPRGRRLRARRSC